MLVPPTPDVASVPRIRRATKRGGLSEIVGVTLDHSILDDLDYLRGDR